MKITYLRINHAGQCQPHQSATGAHYAITDCPDDEPAGAIAQLANLTVITTPYSGDVTWIKFPELGRGKLINLYND